MPTRTAHESWRPAAILMDIAEQESGGRGDSCRDLEGHPWWFGSYDPWKDHG
jgi:uncharacterized glyoxalase superfamily protein PhnB